VRPLEKQPLAIRLIFLRLDLNILKVEGVVMAGLSPWFRKHPKNAHKRLFIKEIFKVAAMQERYRGGEIGMGIVHQSWQGTDLISPDGTSEISIMDWDNTDLGSSDDETGGRAGSARKDEGEKSPVDSLLGSVSRQPLKMKRKSNEGPVSKHQQATKRSKPPATTTAQRRAEEERSDY
jgi:hypothetical protein